MKHGNSDFLAKIQGTWKVKKCDTPRARKIEIKLDRNKNLLLIKSDNRHTVTIDLKNPKKVQARTSRSFDNASSVHVKKVGKMIGDRIFFANIWLPDNKDVKRNNWLGTGIDYLTLNKKTN